MSAAPATATRDLACFHCGLAVPPGIDLQVEVDGAPRPVCCHGCRAVASLILGQGLGEYYARREFPAETPDPAAGVTEDELWNDPALQRDFVRDLADAREATLSIEGIRCAACAWLIEQQLERVPGVVRARVGLATHRAHVVWRPQELALSQIFAAVRRVGYRAHPSLPDREAERLLAERRRALRRVGVAGLAGMQVMMLAVGLYAGAGAEDATAYRDLLRGASWLLAGLVVVYSARPFFEGAWRDLRLGAPGMDVPVALAIGGAYAASTWAVFSGRGEVYFDSVCMFTFFLGLGRYLELVARQRADDRVRGLLRRLPESALRGAEGEEVRVPVRDLAVGDRVLVRPGETIPVDGRVIEGEGAASEALLTGEAEPRRKRPGDRVIGGSQNGDTPLVLRVECVGADGLLATIVRLLDRAQAERPPAVRLTDRIARRFVTAVLVSAAAVGVYWGYASPADAPWIVLSVLVATCPCALSLATPAALAAATNGLAAGGLLATRGHVLETLARVTHFVFDKTGTLTEPGLRVRSVVPVAGRLSRGEVLARARLLEQRSSHPIARALAGGDAPDEAGVAAAVARLRPTVAALRVHASRGVSGEVAGRRLRLGRPEWVAEAVRGGTPSLTPPPGRDAWVLLGDEEGALAWIGLTAALRPDAAEAVARLEAMGVTTSLLSGDPSASAVADTAQAAGISSHQSGATPEQKLAALQALQAGGQVVAAVGDGVNDAPLLACADVSIAMGTGTDLTRVTADAVLWRDRLAVLAEGVRHARRTRRVIRQNLAWAVVYNLSVLPLAAAGQVYPWMAALGMSASSLLVVLNALRLRRLEPSGAVRQRGNPRRAGAASTPVWQTS